MNTVTMNGVVENYFACWNEKDTAARRQLLQAHWAPLATYSDNLASVQGLDGIEATMSEIHARFPEFVFTPHGEVDAHHEHVRFGWALGPVVGETMVFGQDVVSTDDSGLIKTVVGFLDIVPS